MIWSNHRNDAGRTCRWWPVEFLENILLDLRRSGLVTSRRRSERGYRLARPASDITAADVLRLIDRTLAEVRGAR